MFDEAAKAAWYDSPKLYHRTGRFGFTKFNGTIWLTDKTAVAQGYGRKGYADLRKISDKYIIIAEYIDKTG